MSSTERTHRGGCLFCRHVALAKGLPCTHPVHAPLKPLSADAREPGQPCGPRATLWEFCCGGAAGG